MPHHPHNTLPYEPQRLIPNAELKSRGTALQAIGIVCLMAGFGIGSILSPFLGLIPIILGVGAGLFGLVYFLRSGRELYNEGKIGLPEGESPEKESGLIHFGRIFATFIGIGYISHGLFTLLGAALTLLTGKDPSSYSMGSIGGAIITIPIGIAFLVVCFPRYKSIGLRVLLVGGILAVQLIIGIIAGLTSLLLNPAFKEGIKDGMQQAQEIQEAKKDGQAFFQKAAPLEATKETGGLKSVKIPNTSQVLKIPSDWDAITAEKGDTNIQTILISPDPTNRNGEYGIMLQVAEIPQDLVQEALAASLPEKQAFCASFANAFFQKTASILPSKPHLIKAPEAIPNAPAVKAEWSQETLVGTTGIFSLFVFLDSKHTIVVLRFYPDTEEGRAVKPQLADIIRSIKLPQK
jgi:hypothetical protein